MTGSVQMRAPLLARNAALNAVAQLVPLVLALPVLPYVLRTLGAERFAVLTLAWTVIGYFGFLDLGLGRAATRFVAAGLGRGESEEIRRVVWSSLVTQAALGLAGALIIAAAAPFIASGILRIEDADLLAETSAALTWVALGLPLVLLSGTMSGVLEAHQRFDLTNMVRVPANAATLAVPAAGVWLGASLPVIIAAIVGTRALALFGFSVFAARVSGGLAPALPDPAVVRRLLAFGGWLSISMLAAPLLTYAERLLLGGIRSLTDLAHYAVPFEIVARTAVLSSAAALTLFPAFSYAQQRGTSIEGLFHRPLRLLFLLQWPLLVVFWLFPHELLNAWMGTEVATAGAGALRLLALAFFFNGFAQLALAGVQGLGRPDLKAKLDLVQLPLYIGAAALFIARFGITGAAAAKLLFTVVDTAILFLFARRLGAPAHMGLSSRSSRVAVAAALTACVATGAAVALPFTVRVVAAVAGIAVVGAALWLFVLDAMDRDAVRRATRPGRPAEITS